MALLCCTVCKINNKTEKKKHMKLVTVKKEHVLTQSVHLYFSWSLLSREETWRWNRIKVCVCVLHVWLILLYLTRPRSTREARMKAAEVALQSGQFPQPLACIFI